MQRCVGLVWKETRRIVKLDMCAHPCLRAVCWHYWWWTDKVSICHLHQQLRSDNISPSWHPPAQKTLQDKEKEDKIDTAWPAVVFEDFIWGSSRLYGTWGADVGWNLHIRAETQEVAFIGLLVLKGVRHWTHTADWEQRLVRYRMWKVRLGGRGWLSKHFIKTEPPLWLVGKSKCLLWDWEAVGIIIARTNTHEVWKQYQNGHRITRQYKGAKNCIVKVYCKEEHAPTGCTEMSGRRVEAEKTSGCGILE